MIDMFESSQNEGQIFEYIDDLCFHSANPDSGWSSKKKLYEIKWEIEHQLKTLPEFDDEGEWIENRKKALGIK